MSADVARNVKHRIERGGQPALGDVVYLCNRVIELESTPPEFVRRETFEAARAGLRAARQMLNRLAVEMDAALDQGS